LIASVGQFVREVALYWLAYEITGSPIALGILGFGEAVPRLLLSAVGGVIVDRYDRLRLLTTIQFLWLVSVVGMTVLYFLGILQFWHMVALETDPPQHESDGRTVDPARARAGSRINERRVALLHRL